MGIEYGNDTAAHDQRVRVDEALMECRRAIAEAMTEVRRCAPFNIERLETQVRGADLMLEQAADEIGYVFGVRHRPSPNYNRLPDGTLGVVWAEPAAG